VGNELASTLAPTKRAAMTPVLALYRKFARWPLGGWLFSRAVCFKAPYFATISPRILALEPGRCEARMRDRRAVHNHLGTVHAIALCNLAELCAGVMTDASLPRGMRWIPKGMSVRYLAKARGTLTGSARPEFEPRAASEGYELPVLVAVKDAGGETVFDARVLMWLSPASKPSAEPQALPAS
jgi:acyl-coenzyme A thioesterase PaaI-like protein